MAEHTSDRTESDDPLDLLYQRVKNDEWIIDIIEGFEGKSIAIEEKGNNRGFDESVEEREIRKEFLNEYAELVLDIHDINEKYGSSSLEWYIDIGERIKKSHLLNERKKTEFYTIMSEVNSDFTRDTLRWAERVYELFPDVSTTPPLASGDSWFCRLCVKAETAEEVSDSLHNLEEVPGQRVIWAWDNLDKDAQIQEVVEEIFSKVNRDYGFSEEKQVKSVKQVYRMQNRNTPQEGKIREHIEIIRE